MNLTQDGTGARLGAVDAAAQRNQGFRQYLVAQLGARMHYAVPRMLEAEGLLARLCTDICAVKGWPRLLQMIPRPCRSDGVRRLLGRLPTGVPLNKIHAFTAFGWALARRISTARGPGEQAEAYLWAGKRFCELILREGLDGVTGVYTFNTAGLELLRSARSAGIQRVMEQTIAPGRFLESILAEEQSRFPNWETASGSNASVEEVCAREEAEWQEAELILCGSDFVKQSIAACGGPVDRCQVVPYGVDNRFGVGPRRHRGGLLRVLTVGAVGLRKGSPYVLETARRLQGRATFRMVGSIGVSPSAEAALRRVVELTGPVPRSEIAKQYAWADVFFLPSLCEGSATVTYEALACGLPVVCTSNSGSVVRTGIDGFVVPERDTAAMAERLQQFHQDRDCLEFASEQARRRADAFTLQGYGARLMQALHSAGANCDV
jgi:glycosyltransferase involved in cell wall biosynthesis